MYMTRLESAVLLLLCSSARAWVSKTQSIFGGQITEIQAQMRGQKVDRAVEAQLGYLWHMPADIDDTRGLGGGITWAWDDALCAPLQTQFDGVRCLPTSGSSSVA